MWVIPIEKTPWVRLHYKGSTLFAEYTNAFPKPAPVIWKIKVIYSPIDNQQDELIPHDNHEQLQKAFERKTSAIQPNNNFDNI
jgi:hypothetical protein